MSDPKAIAEAYLSQYEFDVMAGMSVIKYSGVEKPDMRMIIVCQAYLELLEKSK